MKTAEVESQMPVIISADSHVMEPLDLWTTHLPEELRSRGPRLEARDGATCLMVEDTIVRRFSSFPRGDETSAANDPRREKAAKTFSAESSDPDRRLRDLDADGVWGDVMYPNLAFFCCHRIRDPGLELATARVYNDWLADRFIGASERFAPIACLPVRDVEATIGELRRVSRRGFRGVLLPAHVDTRPWNDRAYEALWSEAEELGMPLTFHAGTGRTQTPAHGPGGAVVNYVVTVAGPMETAAYLCGSGVLERHPRLRIVLVECGSGWLAWALHAMDDAYREHYLWVEPKLSELPSEYFRRQGFVTFQHDPVGIASIPFTGDGCLMWGSDYPHPEGTWPRSREILDRQLAGLDRGTIQRIVCANAAALYGFRVPTAARPAG